MSFSRLLFQRNYFLPFVTTEATAKTNDIYHSCNFDQKQNGIIHVVCMSWWNSDCQKEIKSKKHEYIMCFTYWIVLYILMQIYNTLVQFSFQKHVTEIHNKFVLMKLQNTKVNGYFMGLKFLYKRTERYQTSQT